MLVRKKIRFYLDLTDKTMHKYETDLVKMMMIILLYFLLLTCC